MGTPYLGEVRILSFAFPPKGWALCNGQQLAIGQNQALFSILGTTYGGNGVQTFGLPNLQGRVPLHFGNGLFEGEVGGEQTHTLVAAEMPAHSHLVGAISSSATISDPTGARHAAANTTNFASGGTLAPLHPSAYGAAGGGQPHDNMSPYLVLSFVIALQGIFPSRT